MATNFETMWVSDDEQLQATVQTLVGRGGVVQGQSAGEVQIQLKKRHVTVRIGMPNSIKTDRQHWYNEAAVEGASPGTVAPAPPPEPSTAHLPPPPATATPETPAPLPDSDGDGEPDLPPPPPPVY